MTDDGKANEPQRDWREMRREDREMRRAGRGGWHGGPWIGGVVLIGLGIAFLMRNFGYVLPENWWALFLLLPGLAALARAWLIYQQTGRLSDGARGALIGGLILTLLSCLFFFNVDLGKFWPVILIVIGVSVLAGSIGRR